MIMVCYCHGQMCDLFSDAFQRENQLYQGHDDLEEVPFPNGTFPWREEAPGSSNTVRKLPISWRISVLMTW